MKSDPSPCNSISKSKVEREGKRAATKPYTEYGEEQRSEADKVTQMIWKWNNWLLFTDGHLLAVLFCAVMLLALDTIAGLDFSTPGQPFAGNKAISVSVQPPASIPDRLRPLYFLPIRVNAATSGELQTIPGIGPTLAERIVAFRTENGNFMALDDLQKVKGIGPKKFESIRHHVTLSEETP